MSQSIISNECECFVCKTTLDLHKHHIYEGIGRRQLSEKYGCWIYLCGRHHNLSNYGIHFNKTLDLKVKKLCQCKLEKEHGWTREQFINTFGRSYE